MGTQGYLCDTHTKKMETRMCDIQTDKTDNTHGICLTFTQRKQGHFHLEIEPKRCGSSHKIRVIYEIKGNNKEVYS